MDVNFLGNFSSIEDVWHKYPEGGNEGDYLNVGGVKYRWNKYILKWENAEVVTDTSSRKAVMFSDVNVQNNVRAGGSMSVADNMTVEDDLTVGGMLRARHVKQPNLGLFPSVEALKSAHPKPVAGEWAVVGNGVPAPVYRCDKDGVWTATGETGGVDALEGAVLYSGKQNLDESQKEMARENIGTVGAEEVIGNPAGDWDKGTAEAYIDKEIVKVKNWVSNTPVTDVVVVETLPASGKKNTLYRVKGTNAYSEYGWDGSKFVLLAVKDYGIDDEPVAGSENLVKSGGVLKEIGNSYLSLPKNVDIWEDNEVGCLHNDGNLYSTHKDFVTTDFLSLKKGEFLVAGVGIVLPSNDVYRSLIIYDLDKQLLQHLLFDNDTITYKATQDVLVRVSFYVDAPADELFLYYGKPGNITRERKEIFPKVGNLIDLESPEAIKDHGIDTQGNIIYYKDMIVAPSIPVIEGNLYTVSMDIKRTIGIIYEDERKNKTDFILITDSPKLIEIPTGVKYVRLIGWSILTGYVYFGPYYSEKSETILANKQLSPYIPASAIEGADSRNMLMFNSPNNLMKYSLNFDGEISPWDAGYVSHPIPVKVGNMIPYYGATENKGITATGEIASYEGGIISKRFKIEGGKSYTFYADYFNTTQVAIRFEDDEGNKVGFELIQRKVTHTFTAPEDATYCIVPLKIHSHPQGYVGMGLSDAVDWCGLHQYVYYEGDKTTHAIRLEDEHHNILSAKLLSSSERALSISPYAECKYIRIGSPSQSAQFKEVGCYDLYPLRGKRIALYGDSITVDYYSEIYAAMMKYRTQALDVQRFGLSGGDYTAHLQQDTYLNPLLNYNPDVVIIHSVNSHRSNRPVGTMSSAEGASDDIGALKKIFRKIIEKNNKVKIYFCLPLCYGEVSSGSTTWVGSTSPNSLGLYLSDYAKGYVDVCRNYGVEIINLTDRCGFKDLVESGNNREYTYDGVHPIWKGYNIMTGIIAEHINNMYNQWNG